MGKIIGIDLGTTKSCVSVFDGNKPIVISNSEGKFTTPSVVSIMKNGEHKVGDPAKRQAITNPNNTIFSINRLMGETYDQVSNYISHLPYKIECGMNNIPCVNIDGQLYTPQEISAMILRKMKMTAESYLGQEVTDAVITVPAYFNYGQRLVMKEAGLIAGLNARYMINGATTAALAYGLDKFNEDMTIVVFDLGGGTFDVSILEFGQGMCEVLSTSGDTHLGGDDFDQVIVDWMIKEFKEEEGIDLILDSMAMQRLKEAAEKAKIELSSSTTTEINLPYITVVGGVPKHLVKTLTRSKFELLANRLIMACSVPCQKAMRDAGLSKDDIDKVILVGGSSRIPAIQRFVESFFGKVPSKGVNPDEVVAVGAAVQGAIMTDEVKGAVLLDVTPFSMGVETFGGVMTKMIDANTSIPCKKTEIFTTANDNQTEVAIHVLQGEHSMASGNKFIGNFHLIGITPAPRGVPQIEVTFDIDAYGTLKVSAKDKATGKVQTVRMEGSRGFSREKIQRMTEIVVYDADETKAHKRKKYDVFISSKSLDYSIAEKIYDFLVANGYRVFLACHELDKLGEAEYSEEIDKVLDMTTHMIVVSTDITHINSKWVKFEWSTFCNDLKCGYRKGNLITILSPTIPIRNLPASLRHKQSFTIDDYKNHILSYLAPIDDLE